MAEEAAEAGLPRSISEIKTFRDIARAAPRSVKMPRLQRLNAVGDTGFFEGQQPTVQRLQRLNAVGDTGFFEGQQPTVQRAVGDGLEDWRGDHDVEFSSGHEPREDPGSVPTRGGLAAVRAATRIGSPPPPPPRRPLPRNTAQTAATRITQRAGSVSSYRLQKNRENARHLARTHLNEQAQKRKQPRPTEDEIKKCIENGCYRRDEGWGAAARRIFS